LAAQTSHSLLYEPSDSSGERVSCFNLSSQNNTATAIIRGLTDIPPEMQPSMNEVSLEIDAKSRLTGKGPLHRKRESAEILEFYRV
jgi:hypothetical protein